MNKLLCTALGLLIAAPVLALGQTPEAAPIATLDSALIATMKAGSANAGFQARYDQLDPVVRQALNMSVITENSVGFLWSTVPADQQQQLLALFEQFTVASYVHEFNGYSGQQIQMLPNEKTLGDKKIVETQIVPGDGSAPTEIDYVMTDTPDSGWQATDVLLGGTVSQVAIHSSDFSAMVTSGDASQLIAALKTKIAALSGGNGSD
jgi:phospholipid transport system substrate-binding protein